MYNSLVYVIFFDTCNFRSMRRWLAKRIERKADLWLEALLKTAEKTPLSNSYWYIAKKEVKFLYSLASFVWK